jgi:putative ABC transport system substrate-binding protein
MRRRDFIAALGPGMMAYPSLAAAEQRERKRLVGLITGFSETEMLPLATAFRARMRELGWTEGRDVLIDVRTANGDYDKLDAEAGRLVAASADVIVAMGTPGLIATRKYTRTTPVVFTQVADPVGQRLVDSLGHPGGNATGLTNFEFSFGGKWVELLYELDPRISHLTLITNPANENTTQFVRVIAAAADARKIPVRIASVRGPADIQDAIETCSKQPGGALIIFPDSLPVVHRAQIIELAGNYKLPAVYPFRIFAEAGGLLSYGSSFKAIYIRAAEYVDKILKGANPSDLPVEAPTKFELVINLKTAKELGLTVSPALQVAADEIIQ